MARFLAGEYAVGTGSARRGMRFPAPPIDHLRGFNITSDGIAPGSIQVPGDGQPIVLMADRQTTGGYPKIATVISADLPTLGRLRIGAKVRFEPVTLEQAHVLGRGILSFLKGLPNRVVPIGRSHEPLAPLLFDYNLISGVVDARYGVDH